MRQGGNDPTSLGQTAKAKTEEIFAFEKLGTTGYNMYTAVQVWLSEQAVRTKRYNVN